MQTRVSTNFFLKKENWHDKRGKKMKLNECSFKTRKGRKIKIKKINKNAANRE